MRAGYRFAGTSVCSGTKALRPLSWNDFDTLPNFVLQTPHGEEHSYYGSDRAHGLFSLSYRHGGSPRQYAQATERYGGYNVMEDGATLPTHP